MTMVRGVGMSKNISKSQFKPKALEIMRKVEKTGNSVVITDHGIPKLELRVYHPETDDPFEKLKGTVLSYTDPTKPVADNDWDLA